MQTAPKKKLLALLPFGIGVLILGVMALVATQRGRSLVARSHDTPPVIDFTWTPDQGAVSLMDAHALLTIKDDYGIDFTTYRMRLVELDKTLDMPIPGLIGKDYSQPVSFSLIADDPKLKGKHTLTVEITVADDKGQVSTLTKVMPLQ